MNSLSLVVLVHVLTGIHGEGRGQNSRECIPDFGVDTLFTCLHKQYHEENGCIETVKIEIQRVMYTNLTDDCLVNICTKSYKKTNNCSKEDCRKLLSLSIAARGKYHIRRDQKKKDNGEKKDEVPKQKTSSFNCDDGTSRITKDENGSKKREENGGIIERKDDIKQDSQNSNYNIDDDNKERKRNENTEGNYKNGDRKNYRKDSQNVNDNIDDDNKEWKRNENAEGNYKNRDRKNYKKGIFKVGAIVGISVGITGTIILFLIILAIIYVCRRRSKEKKRKNQRRQQSIDQRLEMKNLESGSSSTNKGEYIVISENKSLNTYEKQGENYMYVLDSTITQYDKDLRNRKLPEIKRCSGAEDDENVYYEIDEDTIKSSTDMEGVYQDKIKNVTDKCSSHRDQTGYEIPLGSMKKKREKLTTQKLFANESLNTDEVHGEYFVLDPSITKNDKDLISLVLPETKRFSVPQGDKRVYNEIDEDMEGVCQKEIEEFKDKCRYNGEQNIYETPRSPKNKRDLLIRLQSDDQVMEIAHLENSPSRVNKGDNVSMYANESFNTDEEQGEYFVLDPCVTKYEKELNSRILPEVKRFSVAQGDKNVCNEIDEVGIESSPVIKR